MYVCKNTAIKYKITLFAIMPINISPLINLNGINNSLHDIFFNEMIFKITLLFKIDSYFTSFLRDPSHFL